VWLGKSVGGVTPLLAIVATPFATVAGPNDAIFVPGDWVMSSYSA